MSEKKWIWLGFMVGSLVGSYLPSAFGVDPFSGISLIFGSVGSLIGIYIGYKVAQAYATE